MKRYLALTCEALARSIYGLAADAGDTITVQLFKQGLHNRPRGLRETLQSQLDTIPPDEYDAILLVYGMCGNATVGLVARHTPLVIPRAHDCITLYLGSRERYQAEFDQHPGTYWYSADYLERQDAHNQVALGAVGIADSEQVYDEYVLKFGQETADMLVEEMRKWSQHYTRAAFIDTGYDSSGRFEQMARDKAEREDWLFERKQGNDRLLRLLIQGEWSPEEFLIVPPRHIIQQSFDDGLVRAVPL